jgi:hypothetical protein
MSRCFDCSGVGNYAHSNRRCQTCDWQVSFCFVCYDSRWPPRGRTENCCHKCVSKRREGWLARVAAFVASEWYAVLPDLVRRYLVPALYRSNPPPLTSYWDPGKVKFPNVPYCIKCAAHLKDDYMRYKCSVCKLRFNLCRTCKYTGTCIFCKE